MIPTKSVATLLVVSCAVLLDCGHAFTTPLTHRYGGLHAGLHSTARERVVAWAKKRKLTLGPCLETLGLQRGASLHDAKEAFRREVSFVHPDRNSSPEAAERYAQLTEAYAVATKELRGHENNKPNVGDDLFKFAHSCVAFTHAFGKEVVVPMTRDVAVPVAQYMCKSVIDGAMTPLIRSVKDAATSEAQEPVMAINAAELNKKSQASRQQKIKVFHAFNQHVLIQRNTNADKTVVAETAAASAVTSSTNANSRSKASLAHRALIGLVAAWRTQTTAQSWLQPDKLQTTAAKGLEWLHAASKVLETRMVPSSIQPALYKATLKVYSSASSEAAPNRSPVQARDLGSARAHSAIPSAAAFYLRSTAAKQQDDSAMQAKEMASMANRFTQQMHRDALSLALAAKKCASDAIGCFDFPVANAKSIA